jgi:succinoglycan biosynthesis protein ExoV
MPHYTLLPDGNWKQACELAGVEFLDPLADSEETVQRIRRAKLVIAGAMHAAIAADALRVPWIPIVVSSQSNSFKWLDWTMSLELPYRPAKLQASTFLELVRNQSVSLVGPKFYFEDHTPAKVITHCKRVVRFKSWKCSALLRQPMTRITYSLPRRIITSAAFSGFKQQQDEKRTYRAAEQLRRIAEMPSYLSNEQVLTSKLDQIVSLLPRLQP